MTSPVEGALEEARQAVLDRFEQVLNAEAARHGEPHKYDGFARLILNGSTTANLLDALIAAARSGHDGLRGDRRLVELYSEWSEEYYAAGFISPTPSSVESFVRWLSARRAAAPAALKDYELAMLDMLPVDVRAARPEPRGRR